MLKKKLYSISVLALLMSVGTVAPLASAQTADTTTVTQTTTVQTKSEEAKAKAKEKAAAQKLRVCKQKSAKLQTRLDKIAEQGKKQLDVFTDIYTKVQAFKTAKKYEVANYDTLVKKVEDARKVADEAVAKAATAPTIDCESATPKTVVTTYKTAVQARNTALKNYKTAVHDLLVAVKNSQRQNTADKTVTTTTDATTTTTTGGNQ